MEEVAVEDDGVVGVGEFAPAEVLSSFEAVLEVEGEVGVGVEGEVYGGYFAFPFLPRRELFRGLCL